MKLIILFIYQILGSFTYSKPGECIDDGYCDQYLQALNITQTPTTEKIIKSLIPLRPSNPDLKFDAENRVLLAAAVKLTRYPYLKGEKFQLYQDTRFTPYPFFQKSCTAYDKNSLYIRAKQQLGLPPTDDMTGIIEVYVSLFNIFRACPDPEISDKECVINIPVLNNNSIYPEVPWYCPDSEEKILQIGKK